MKTLSSLSIGEKATVDSITAKGPMRRRLQDIGLVSGVGVECLQKSFFGDPTAYLIRDTVIAIRREDAEQILLQQAVSR